MKWIIGLIAAAVIAAAAFFYFKKKATGTPATAASTGSSNDPQPLNPPITFSNGSVAFYKGVSDTGVNYYDKNGTLLKLSLAQKLAVA